MALASANVDGGEGGYLVRGPRMTDAIGGALLRSYAHRLSLPEDMRRLVELLDRQPRGR